MSTVFKHERIDRPILSAEPALPGFDDDGSEPKPEGMAAHRKKIIYGVLIGVCVVALVIGATVLIASFSGDDQALVSEPVKRGDLAIVVTVRGNIESQENVRIVCELDDLEGDRVHGTPILSIVPNGSSVKKGDLLVEFERSGHDKRFEQQKKDTLKAERDQIQAESRYNNQLAVNKTLKANAALAVRLAELELEMYEDPENGTHKLEVEAINRLVDDANNLILQSQASLELKRNEKVGIESLFKLGYAGKSELDRVRLDFLQAENQYAANINKLRTQLSTLKKKETYERQMQQLSLQGQVATAKRATIQVDDDSLALVKQAKAETEAADEQLKEEKKRLERYENQLEKIKIFSPKEGMVAYYVSTSPWRKHEVIEQGKAIRPQQNIISIPDLKRMQIRTAVHESVLDQIKMGLPVTVHVDAFPNRSYKGSVKSVAVLAQSGSDTKNFETVITIDEEVEGLKPGMTAEVKIHVDKLKDVLFVPVHAIEQAGRESWCYVKTDDGVKRKTVTLGRSNNKFVEIREGLEEGDIVVHNPMAVVDDTRPKSDDEADESPSDQPTSAKKPPAKAQPPQRGTPQGGFGQGKDGAGGRRAGGPKGSGPPRRGK